MFCSHDRCDTQDGIELQEVDGGENDGADNDDEESDDSDSGDSGDSGQYNEQKQRNFTVFFFFLS